MRTHNPLSRVPENVCCPICEAPHDYIYYNDGKKRTQLKCKVCDTKFQLNKRYQASKPNGLFCPYCGNALYKWKQQEHVTLYKCDSKKCPCRQTNLKKLNAVEKAHRLIAPNLYTVNYIYREYHFTPMDLQHSKPDQIKTKYNLFRIQNSEHVLGLILSIYISFAISARKTAWMLQQIFNLNVSHQTVLNYARAAAYYCHRVNMEYKGDIDDTAVGDETYLKINGKNHYTWFFISSKKKSITAYHLSGNRETVSAITAIKEAVRTRDPNQQMTIVTDGNPAYTSALLYINEQDQGNDKHPKINQIKVIGLKNLDKVSSEYRPFKQIVERLNRTYKHHVRPSAGFNSFNGAMAMTALFVSHYNFLRPHGTLGYNVPIHLPQLTNIKTIQAKWIHLLKMGCEIEH